MYNKVTAMKNKFLKFMADGASLIEKQKKALIPFLEIAKDENLTDCEKITKLYELSKNAFFCYGKKRNIKGGDLIFQITEAVKDSGDKVFDELRGVYYNITKNEACEF